jgi:hypothetical protein
MHLQHITSQHCVVARHSGYVGFPPLSLPHSPPAVHRSSGQQATLVTVIQIAQKGKSRYFTPVLSLPESS